MSEIALDSELLDYLTQAGFKPGDRLPTLSELQDEKHLGISISKVREQLEVARALGFVEVRSKTGMKLKPYSFAPAVRVSLLYALAQDHHNFELFSEVRNHIEVAFWNEACERLREEDKRLMSDCITKAYEKLNGKPARIPYEEHRAFHLTVFRRLENPFVMGILEGYWDAYNAVELSRYADYSYLQQVWSYHERIFKAICSGAFEAGKTLLIEHTQLIRHQPRMQYLQAEAEANPSDS